MYRTSPIFTADQFLHLKQVLGIFYLLGKTSPTANSNSEKLCKLSEQALVDYEQGCGVQAIQLSVLQRQSFCSWEGIFPFFLMMMMVQVSSAQHETFRRRDRKPCSVIPIQIYPHVS